MKFALIFAMGSDMGQYFCVFDAPTRGAAEEIVARAYPSRWTYLLPHDARFLAHVRAYQKEEIQLGAQTVLRDPNEALPGG
jgi:hypothetical protein